ncbi:MAG: hypothetical protein ACI8QD_001366 [Cyclobacteriaceae bacterium]|jgi:hypothetical protein
MKVRISEGHLRVRCTSQDIEDLSNSKRVAAGLSLPNVTRLEFILFTGVTESVTHSDHRYEIVIPEDQLKLIVSGATMGVSFTFQMQLEKLLLTIEKDLGRK